ncbi:MAG TPA: glycosyltransferase [Jatrophihabitans sp.]|nr:glycosyltransferase [Jatrophihabitans sp.]
MPEPSDPARAPGHEQPAGGPSRRLVHLSEGSTIGGIAAVVRAELAQVPGWLEVDWLTLGTADLTRELGPLLHRALYGADGPEQLAAADPWRRLRDFGAAAAARLADQVAGADALVLHDPLCLSLAPHLRPLVGRILWRCHIGSDEPGPDTRAAIAGLRPYLDSVEVVAFLRPAYVWPGLPADKVLVVPPGIDPDGAKNRPLSATERSAGDTALRTGYWGTGRSEPDRVLDDNGTGFLRPGARFVLQASRWDQLKGHEGVLAGVRALAERHPDLELVLAGPHIDPARNYPENTALLADLLAARAAAPAGIRDRLHVWSFAHPADPREPLLVNLLQRTATVVVQNSLREGFGLTVTEALWKGAAVLASAVGGLREQVTDEVTGVLTGTTDGGPAWQRRLDHALADAGRRARWGAAGRERVRQRYLAGSALQAQLCALGLPA